MKCVLFRVGYVCNQRLNSGVREVYCATDLCPLVIAAKGSQDRVERRELISRAVHIAAIRGVLHSHLGATGGGLSERDSGITTGLLMAIKIIGEGDL